MLVRETILAKNFSNRVCILQTTPLNNSVNTEPVEHWTMASTEQPAANVDQDMARFLTKKEELEVDKIFRALVKLEGSDLHMKVGRPPIVRINWSLKETSMKLKIPFKKKKKPTMTIKKTDKARLKRIILYQRKMTKRINLLHFYSLMLILEKENRKEL